MKAFVRYSNNGTIISGTLLKVKNKPSGAGWVEVPLTLCCSGLLPVASNSTSMKAYVKYDGNGNVVSGSTIVRKKKPSGSGRWVEIPYKQCCDNTPNPSPEPEPEV